MKFVFLTQPEVEGAAIRWKVGSRKSPELLAAALAAGFSDREARASPVGVLEQAFPIGPDLISRRGARVLIGTNGSTLMEVT